MNEVRKNMSLFRKKERKDETNKQQKETNKSVRKTISGQNAWIFRGILISFVFSAVFSCFYGVFRKQAEKEVVNPVAQAENIDWLFQNSYLLYRDLYNVQNETHSDYANIYLETDEKYSWLLDEQKMHEIIAEESAETYEKFAEANGISFDECMQINGELDNLKGFFEGLENGFVILNSNFDYCIRDNNTGRYVTNMSEDDMLRDVSELYFRLSFSFDSAGYVTVNDIVSEREEDTVRRLANEVIRGNTLQSLISQTLNSFGKYGSVGSPKDCTVTYSISAKNRETGNAAFKISSQYYSNGINYYVTDNYITDTTSKYTYVSAGVGAFLLLGLLGMFLLGCFMPQPNGDKPWKRVLLCSLPFEALLTMGICFLPLGGNLVVSMIAWVASRRAVTEMSEYMRIAPEGASFIAGCINLAVLTLYFFVGWYFGICAGAIREKSIIGYIKERSLIYRFFPFIKGKLLNVYRSIEHLDLTKDAHKTIIKLVLFNAVILFIISSLWFGGFAITVIYSILLYLILRKYISDLQKKYSILLKATNEMAEGNLNVTINEDLGVFEPFKPQVLQIQNGFRKAVNEEVKSQKMKAELITNVSHDLKTPLTAIITYVNLLKEEGITEEQRKEYLDILERKSLRLKVLIEDLFEVSKANSRNITINRTDVDIMNLIKQVSFEMSDKLSTSGLDIRMNLTDEKIILSLDSQKTFRIYENLFGNIAKYGMAGTRVYVNGFRIDDKVIITLKNISAQELTMDSSELTERFVRGDASRNTEGSGLGLAIAKSFTELQGGELTLELDGDLFKVTTTWPVQSTPN